MAKPLHFFRSLWFPIIYLFILTWLALIGWQSWWAVLWCFLLSGSVFLLYGWDKTAAETKRFRIPELWLHGLSYLGGWPGANVAQLIFKHKNKKNVFQIIHWFGVVINSAVFLLTPTISTLPRF
jgi:uncharacterized membrane protein YsdA (DUF1294 family)